MKELVISRGTVTTIKDVPIPKAQPGQVVIKVAFSGSNPKDWKYPDWKDTTDNQGDDIAGTVHELGEGTSGYGLKVGDRVAAFHQMLSEHGSYAEYAVAWAYTTFPLPDKTSFEEGASLPLAALTAVVGLYSNEKLSLPQPWTPAKQPIPLIVYGASTAVGSYAVQLARLSNIHPIIAVAGKAQDHVKSLIDTSKGDVFVDYRNGMDKMKEEIKTALKGAKAMHAFDCICEKDSFVAVCESLSGGHVTTVLPVPESAQVPSGIDQSMTWVGAVHDKEKDLGYVFSRYLSRLLEEGRFKGQPTETVPGGLDGVQGALRNLKDGKASAVKYVFRIADTPGVTVDR